MQSLALSHNSLTGPIPPELAELTRLQSLLLTGNDLTGCIPPALRSVADNDLELLGLPDCSS